MQSAVNGQLRTWLQDGNACAVISFANGLVVMFYYYCAQRNTPAIRLNPYSIKEKSRYGIGFAGLCGAMN
ncbi:DMT family transporter [Salmonella enterica subsp. enterica]|nr:DMT family transporter [Salmonella enterica subsp. enterica]